jgi:hypothetical protein
VQKRRDKVWMASAGQIAQWWRDRERLSITSSVSGKKLDFNLTVKGEQPIHGVTLTVIQPIKGIAATVVSTKIGAPTPRVIPLDEYRSAVIFQSLKPGDYVYQATFEN